MKRYERVFALTLLIGGAIMLAQEPPPPPPPGPPPFAQGRPPMERAFHTGAPGRWWNNPEMARKLGLSADQQRKMDDIFQQNRLKLIDLNASLQKEEAVMDPLMQADQPDEGKILSQIDRVAQARAELEKANARMLLGIRRVLTPDQWKKLQAEGPRGPGARPGRPPAPGQGPQGPDGGD